MAHSWENDVIGYVNQACYFALVSHWVLVAWRVEAPSGGGGVGQCAEPEGPHTLARLAG